MIFFMVSFTLSFMSRLPEYITMGRRILSIAITVVISDRVQMYTILTVFNLAFQFLHVRFNPFQLSAENHIEAFSLTFLTIITGQLFPLPSIFCR